MTSIYPATPSTSNVTVGQGLTRTGLSTPLLPLTAISNSSNSFLVSEGESILSVGASSSLDATSTPDMSLAEAQPTSEVFRQGQYQALQEAAPNAVPSSYRLLYGQTTSRMDPSRLSSTSTSAELPGKSEAAAPTGPNVPDVAERAPAAEENANSRISSKLGTGGIAGMAVGIFAAIAILVALLWFYKRRGSLYGSRTVKRGSQPGGEQSLSQYPSEGWTEFQAVTPTIEKGAVSSDSYEKPRIHQPNEETLQTCYVPDAGVAVQNPMPSSIRKTPYELFSQYSAVLPPPSMRSKRTSAITNRSAGQATVDTALDSVLCLPYPAPDRADSADLSALAGLNRSRSRSLRLSKSQSAPDVSSGVTSPARSGSQRTNASKPTSSPPPRSPVSTMFPNTTRSSLSAAFQADESLSPTPAYSQRSTMTEISLSAVGMGRAM